METKKTKSRFWSREIGDRSWHPIPDTLEEQQRAIRSGAMFFSIPLFDQLPEEGGAEPTRFGPMVLDFDCKDNPAKAFQEARFLLSHLADFYSLDVNAVELFASGGKGAHAIIPAECFGAENGYLLLPLAYKKLASVWKGSLGLETLDLSLFCMGLGKMVRFENIRRENGRFKVPLSLDEFMHLSIDEITQLTMTPRQIDPVDGADFECTDLALDFREKLEQIHREHAEVKDIPPVDPELLQKLRGKVAPCIAYIITAKPKTEKTTFNGLVMILCQYFEAAGFALDNALDIVSRFLAEYPHSTTYLTPEARIKHFRAQWAYIQGHDSYRFRCAFILGKGFPGSAFDCGKCPTKLEPGQEQAKEEPKKNRTPFELIHVGDLVVKAIEWLIRDFIETDSLGLIFGDPGTFKSFISIAFACCVASGIPFCGHPVRQGTAIYIAGEGKNGLARRFKAWGIRNGVDLKNLPLFVSAAPTGLCDADQTKFVMDAISEISKSHGEPALIVVDTVARNFGPGDENSTKDMSGFVSSCDLIRAQYGATVLLVHHCGLSDKTRSRGNMALKAALDVEFRVDKDETGVIRFESTKMKDALEPSAIALRPSVVEIGMVDGEIITSVVLDQTSYEPPPQKGKEGKGKWQTVAMEVLENLQDEHERRLSEKGFDPETARVSVDDWRAACKKKGLKDRQSWKRVKDTLYEQQKVIIENGFVELF